MTHQRRLSRRSFLKLSAAAAGATALSASLIHTTSPATAQDMTYSQAPMLDDMGLPPVADRLPANPRIVPVREEIGTYGGTWRRGFKGRSDMQGPAKLIYAFGLHFNIPDLDTIEIVEGLYDEWSQNDDATEFTFHIREGMRWSDGEPFTTNDVQFWYDWYYQGDFGPSYSLLNVGGEPMELEVVDDYTFTVRFAASNPLLPFRVARDDTEGQHGGPTMAAPAHYLSQFIPDIGDQEAIDAALAQAEVTTAEELFGNGDKRGPINWWAQNPDVPVMTAWRMTEPIPLSDPIVMERNPYFYCVDETGQQLPYIDRIEHNLFDDNNVFDLWVAQGQIDMHERHVSPANFTLYKEGEADGNYTVYLWKGALTHAYYPNTSVKDDVLREIFMDVRFREALSISIDREEINNLVYDGLYEPRQASPVSGSPYYDAEFEQRWTEFNPERAMALLDEMGLEVNDDGFRLRPDGDVLQIILMHSKSGDQSRQDEIGLVVGYWNAIGLRVIEDPVERSLYEERIDSNEIEMGHWEHDRSLLIEADPSTYIATTDQLTYVTAYADWYEGLESGVEPPADHPMREVWNLWDAAATEPDEQARFDLVMQMLAVHKEAPFGIGTVGEPPAPVIVSNNMINVPNGIVTDTSLRNVRVANPEQFFFREV